MLGSMDLERVFVGIDAVRWAEAEHAYGAAEDVPGLLRALAGDPDEASEALDELWGSIVHQGTVYGASAEAVPFLARLAAAGVRPAELLALLGAIASGAEDGRPVGPAPAVGCRAAVAARLPLILPLIDDPDARIRRAAIWAAGATADPAALPALHRRRAEEKDPVARAELLAALARADPAGAVERAGDTLADGDGDGDCAQARLTALVTVAEAGAAWTESHRDALLSLLPAAPLVSGRFAAAYGAPLRHVVDVLLARETGPGREAAYGVVESALRLPGGDARAEALWAAEHLCTVSRGAPPRLAPVLVSLLDDPAFPHTASLLPVLERLGDHAAAAVPALAALAEGGGELAARALEVLAGITPAGAARLLGRDLGARGRTVAVLVERAPAVGALPLAYTPELLNSIRIALTSVDTGWSPAHPADRLAGRQLADRLTAWGGLAAAALPELTALFTRAPAEFAPAVVAVCPPEARRETAALLRRTASAGEPADRYAAADALHTLTGESEPLIDLLRDALAGGSDALPTREHIARAAAGLGSDGLVLIPRLRAALAGPAADAPEAELLADTATATALARITGDPGEAVAVLQDVLTAAAGRRTPRVAHRCAGAAAELGPAARPLVPALTGLLDAACAVPAVILALYAIGAPPPGAAGLVLESLERGIDPPGCLAALERLGAEALTPADTARLTDLAERDRRVRDPLDTGRAIRTDDELRAGVRALLAAGSGTAGPGRVPGRTADTGLPIPG
ncbi:HEAT repeat domain-containing protein [Streptomyces sp. NPDC006798]|uniref:HEAT repeat domain-containing protein n=1 Tax=Streptomyces sp. NPDC006798 TaxID=3155462 RepID=UPI0033E0B51A